MLRNNPLYIYYKRWKTRRFLAKFKKIAPVVVKLYELEKMKEQIHTCNNRQQFLQHCMRFAEIDREIYILIIKSFEK